MWEEAKGKRGEGCAMEYGYYYYHSIPFNTILKGHGVINLNNYRYVLSVIKRHLHRRTNQTKALTEWQLLHIQ